MCNEGWRLRKAWYDCHTVLTAGELWQPAPQALPAESSGTGTLTEFASAMIATERMKPDVVAAKAALTEHLKSCTQCKHDLWSN